MLICLFGAEPTQPDSKPVALTPTTHCTTTVQLMGPKSGPSWPKSREPVYLTLTGIDIGRECQIWKFPGKSICRVGIFDHSFRQSGKNKYEYILRHELGTEKRVTVSINMIFAERWVVGMPRDTNSYDRTLPGFLCYVRRAVSTCALT